MNQMVISFSPNKPTRLDIVRNLLSEAVKRGEPGFDIKRLTMEAERRYGREWILQDTIRKESDILKKKGEFNFITIGKGVRKFIKEGV